MHHPSALEAHPRVAEIRGEAESFAEAFPMPGFAMPPPAKEANGYANGHANGYANGHANGTH